MCTYLTLLWGCAARIVPHSCSISRIRCPQTPHLFVSPPISISCHAVQMLVNLHCSLLASVVFHCFVPKPVSLSSSLCKMLPCCSSRNEADGSRDVTLPWCCESQEQCCRCVCSQSNQTGCPGGWAGSSMPCGHFPVAFPCCQCALWLVPSAEHQHWAAPCGCRAVPSASHSKLARPSSRELFVEQQGWPAHLDVPMEQSHCLRSWGNYQNHEFLHLQILSGCGHCASSSKSCLVSSAGNVEL